MKKNILILFLALIAQSLQAAESSPYAFLKNNSTARFAGMSNAVVSLKDDPAILFFNPAAIFATKTRNFNATFLKYVLDINSGNASYIIPTRRDGTFAVAAVFTNYGSFDYTDSQGNPTGGSFSSNLVSLSGSYSNIIDSNLYYGATLKLIYNSLDDMNGIAVAVDAGLLYTLSDKRTNLGISILNAGTELKKMGNDSYSLPLDIRIGGCHRLRGLPLLFNFNFNHLNEMYSGFFSRFANFSVGGEIYFGEHVQARLGYDNYIRKNIASEQNKGITGFSAGLGIATKPVNVDYGLTIYTNDLLLHRFSISLTL